MVLQYFGAILVTDISTYKDFDEKLSNKHFSYTLHFHYKKRHFGRYLQEVKKISFHIQ